MRQKIKYEYLLVAIAAIWALLFSFLIQLKAGYSIIGDDLSYVTAAKELYLYGRLNDARPIGIALINGFPLLFGFGEQAVIKWSNAINFCCWFFTAFLLFKILTTWISRKASFFYAIFFIFCIGNLANAFNILAEAIFIFLLMSAIFLINKQIKTSDYSYLTLSISILIFAILVKPLAMGIVLILLLFYIKKWKAILLNRFSVFILCGVVLVFVQMQSMKKNHGDFTVSYIDAAAYYNYLGAKAYCLKKNIDFNPGYNERSAHFYTLSSHEQKQLANADIVDQMKNNTVNLMKAYWFCMYSNSSKGSYIVGECRNFEQTAYFEFFHDLFRGIAKIQNIVLTVVGVSISFYGLLRRKNKLVPLLSTLILYVFFTSALSCFQTDRFHIVFFPFVILLIALLLAETSVKLQDQQTETNFR